jgi:hypothetical protein
MKKLLLIALLFTACRATFVEQKKVKRENVTFIFDPKVWSVVEFTVEDSIRIDSLIKLNNQKTN